MKKIFFILALISVAFTSCNKTELTSSEKPVNNEKAIVVSDEGIEPDTVIQNFIEKNPQYYNFADSHSDLWIDDSKTDLLTLRATTSQPSISAIGYDVKTQIGSGTTLFPTGLSCDNRVIAFVNYAYVKYQYKKIIKIPAGADLILPPSTVMSVLAPMGIKPGSRDYGFTSSFVSTDGVNDTYYLITEGNEIVYNSNGQQVAPLNNPIYYPCKIRMPSQLLFKYQYSDIAW